MMNNKELGRIRRHKRIRKKLLGTEERPRLCIYRSLQNLYVQVIDDVKAHTLFSFSTTDKEFKKSITGGTKKEKSGKLGEFYAEKLKTKGIKKIAFDRSGYKFHGRIEALAESLRKQGIEF